MPQETNQPSKAFERDPVLLAENLLVDELTVGGDALDRAFFYTLTENLDDKGLRDLKAHVRVRLADYYAEVNKAQGLEGLTDRDVRFIDKSVRSWFHPWTRIAGEMEVRLGDPGDDLVAYRDRLVNIARKALADPALEVYRDREIPGWTFNRCYEAGLDYTRLPADVKTPELEKKYAETHPYYVDSKEFDLLARAYGMGRETTERIPPGAVAGLDGFRWSRAAEFSHPFLVDGKRATGLRFIDFEDCTNVYVKTGPREVTPFYQFSEGARRNILEEVYYQAKAQDSRETEYTESKGGYVQRTRENALSADYTIAFAVVETPGEKRTKIEAGEKLIPVKIETTEHDRAILSDAAAMKAASDILSSMKKDKVTLNVAGNVIYTLKNYGVHQSEADHFVYKVFAALRESGVDILRVRSGGQTGFDEAGIAAARALGIPTLVHAPAGWLFRGEDNVDRRDEAAFKERFESKAFDLIPYTLEERLAMLQRKEQNDWFLSLSLEDKLLAFRIYGPDGDGPDQAAPGYVNDPDDRRKVYDTVKTVSQTPPEMPEIDEKDVNKGIETLLDNAFLSLSDGTVKAMVPELKECGLGAPLQVAEKDGYEIFHDRQKGYFVTAAKDAPEHWDYYKDIRPDEAPSTFLVTRFEDGKSNLLRPDTGLLSPAWFDECGPEREGMRWIRDGELCNHVDVARCALVSSDWCSEARDFHDGWAVVKAGPADGEEAQGRFNYVNRSGEILSQNWFDVARDFNAGRAIVTLGDESYRIDTHGMVQGRIQPSRAVQEDAAEQIKLR